MENRKMRELNKKEIKQVSGGVAPVIWGVWAYMTKAMIDKNIEVNT
ncbi:class IIb bacteriocin, lactobin A/cerein 7B family [Thalassomonas sp. M1454]|nr:class IIb bacteriocin, lactobin A/cerein 7B family [Thalassomonas sp. M1454]TRX52735.1 class IIb bacteriocin, lactobin A/cerein 7B family [Thalassomonas sp. M1454]